MNTSCRTRRILWSWAFLGVAAIGIAWNCWWEWSGSPPVLGRVFRGVEFLHVGSTWADKVLRPPWVAMFSVLALIEYLGARKSNDNQTDLELGIRAGSFFSILTIIAWFMGPVLSFGLEPLTLAAPVIGVFHGFAGGFLNGAPIHHKHSIVTLGLGVGYGPLFAIFLVPVYIVTHGLLVGIFCALALYIVCAASIGLSYGIAALPSSIMNVTRPKA
jgi:hypothetical protein